MGPANFDARILQWAQLYLQYWAGKGAHQICSRRKIFNVPTVSRTTQIDSRWASISRICVMSSTRSRPTEDKLLSYWQFEIRPRPRHLHMWTLESREAISCDDDMIVGHCGTILPEWELPRFPMAVHQSLYLVMASATAFQSQGSPVTGL